MLRQLFRTRGAYNVVNLPVAASQDDPGRADHSTDWRHHATFAQAESDLGLEAWQQPNWYADRSLSSAAAAKILKKRLENFGPQRERSLQEVIQRIRNVKDAETALKIAEGFRVRRAGLEQHTPLKCSTSKLILQRALEVDARDVIIQALARKDELGFNFVSLKAYRLAITHFSTKRDLQNVIRVFELAKRQGLKPNRDIGFCVLRACLDCKRADLAYAYALEFQANGLRVSPAQKVLIEGESGKMLPPFPGDDSSEVGTESTLAASESPSRGPSQSFASSIAEGTAVLEEADRIIAAASNSPGVVSPEAKGTVSADGVPEISNPSTQTVTSEAAVTEEGKKEDPSPVGGSGKVVAATAVAPPTTSQTNAGAKLEPSFVLDDEEKELLRLVEMPGMEEAVKAHVLLLFPEKEKKPDPLRRSNSM